MQKNIHSCSGQEHMDGLPANRPHALGPMMAPAQRETSQGEPPPPPLVRQARLELSGGSTPDLLRPPLW